MHHVGVEPTSPLGHQGLNLTCLPISPMTQKLKIVFSVFQHKVIQLTSSIQTQIVSIIYHATITFA